MKSFSVFLEDGGAGAAPATSTAGLGSVNAPDGSKVSPPVSRKAQRRIVKKRKHTDHLPGRQIFV